MIFANHQHSPLKLGESLGILDLYFKTLEGTILKAEPRRCKSNLSLAEREAIITLRKNKNIVIFEVDKGGAVSCDE